MNKTTGNISIVEDYLSLNTKGFCDIHDITDQVESMVASSGIKTGHVLVTIPGATAGITTIEYEPGLLKDLPEFFDRIIPRDISYHHDNTWHDGNGFSHLRASLLKPSLMVGISQARLVLGTWQQIIVVDFDNRPRSRKVYIQITGI
ncbi:MAG: secondary thiamine-phosphate synthase enzyme YjbQ [Calditrichia bacterium]